MMDDPDIALEDDDYDALNDETFGNETEEFTWGGEEMDFEGGSNTFDKDLKSPSEATGTIEVDDYSDVMGLEASISRLMDEPDMQDMKPQTRKPLNVPYFLPPQVMSKQYWQQEQEAPGDSSLLVGSSVWSMHPAELPDRVTPTASSFSQENVPCRPSRETDNKIGDYHKQGTSTHSTDDDKKPIWLVQMLKRGADDAKPKTGPVKTLTEIENELLSDNNFIGSPPRSQIPKQIQTRDTSSSDSWSSWSDSSGSPTKPTQPVQPLGSQTHILQNQPLSPGMLNSQYMSMYESTYALPPGFIGYNTRESDGPRTSGQLPLHMVSTGGSVPPGMRPLHPHPLGMTRMNPPPFRQFNQRMTRPPTGPRPQWHNSTYDWRSGSELWDEYRANGLLGRDVDIYSGLMTDKDKQRLKNIQIIQLQNDHPYTADYYFQMKYFKTLKIDVPEEVRDWECFRKLYPASGTENSRNNYQPTHFENSLGKLQAASALAPKKAIDTGTATRHSLKDAWRSPSRTLQIIIERIYSKVLKVEEADFRANLRKCDDNFLQLREKDLESAIRMVYEVGPDSIIRYNKGKMLLCRIILLQKPKTRCELFIFLIGCIPDWYKDKTEIREALKFYEAIREIVFSLNESEMNTMFKFLSVDYELLRVLSKSKIGNSFLFCFLHQIETLHIPKGITAEKMPQLSEREQKIYKCWEGMITDIITHCFSDESETPYNLFDTLRPLLRRFTLRRTSKTRYPIDIDDVQDRLELFFADGSKDFAGRPYRKELLVEFYVLNW